MYIFNIFSFRLKNYFLKINSHFTELSNFFFLLACNFKTLKSQKNKE